MHATCSTSVYLIQGILMPSVWATSAQTPASCILLDKSSYHPVQTVPVASQVGPSVWFCSSQQWPELLATERGCIVLLLGTNWIYIRHVEENRPPLWSSGQSSWLQNGDVLCFLWGTNWVYICYVEESNTLSREWVKFRVTPCGGGLEYFHRSPRES
jgi:hypothetical protein